MVKKMYPEGEQAAPAPPMDYPESGFKSRLTANLEGLIPLILILVIVAYAGQKIGFWNVPFLGGKEPIKMLVIGDMSHDLRVILDNDRDLVRYSIRDADSLNVSPKDVLAQYKIVMLNQSTIADKTVSRVLGEAIQEWVKQGGKMIVVMDSGIYRKGAVDVIGWQATFGDIMPISCDYDKDMVASCERPIHVTGKIYRQDWKSKIMEGIEVAPVEPDMALFLQTFNVNPTGTTIAYIQSATSAAYYPAIVEKTWMGIGKVIYFNYDPGKTQGIFENTLEYLR
jgi:hypothetical protein